jgi:hypothetical protein
MGRDVNFIQQSEKASHSVPYGTVFFNYAFSTNISSLTGREIFFTLFFIHIPFIRNVENIYY